jgi:thiamine kinase-like enzyme
MAFQGAQHQHLSDLEIVQRCLAPNRQIIGGVGALVIKLSEEVVVKFGWNVTAEEANNQRKAFDLLDPRIVRIPQIYRYFTHNTQDGFPPTGFIVMEYIQGKILQSPNSDQIDQLAHILLYFSTIRSQHPGPLQGGISRGLLWEDSGKPSFKTVHQMESWLNVRLPDVVSKLALGKYPLVLCHLDLAPRNIIWLADGSVCLIDWASAGFYPRFFEVCLLKIMEYSHENYEVDLIERMVKLADDEQNQMILLQRSFYNGIKYSFVSLSLFYTTLDLLILIGQAQNSRDPSHKQQKSRHLGTHYNAKKLGAALGP